MQSLRSAQLDHPDSHIGEEIPAPTERTISERARQGDVRRGAQARPRRDHRARGYVARKMVVGVGVDFAGRLDFRLADRKALGHHPAGGSGYRCCDSHVAADPRHDQARYATGRGSRHHPGALDRNPGRCDRRHRSVSGQPGPRAREQDHRGHQPGSGLAPGSAAEPEGRPDRQRRPCRHHQGAGKWNRHRFRRFQRREHSELVVGHARFGPDISLSSSSRTDRGSSPGSTLSAAAAPVGISKRSSPACGTRSADSSGHKHW